MNKINKTYGDLTVKCIVKKDKWGQKQYLVKCSCGFYKKIWNKALNKRIKEGGKCNCSKNEIIKHKDYAEIILTDGQTRVKVDLEDLDRLRVLRWVLSSKGYAVTYLNNSQVAMHRYVLGLTDKSIIVDHANRDRLDNRKFNLRECTYRDNNRNRPSNKNSSSQYKGVSYYKKLNKWVAQCDMNGKHKCIGYFDTEECAAKAYDRYVLSITKDTNYVYLNFPSE